MLSKVKSIKDKIPVSKPSSKKSTPAERYIVALDIGTEFVKALIGRVVGDSVEIIGVGRSHQELTDMQAGAIADIAGVVQNCDKALSEAEQMAETSVRSTIIGIAGELVKGTTLSIRFSRKNPAKELDVAEVEKIISLVQQRAETKARSTLAWELGGKDVEVRLVNSALVRIDIDGYKVTNPVGFQGKDVLVELYTAFAPMIHIGALERTSNELDLELLAVAAEPFAVARSVIGNDPAANMSAILMDVGGGTTDIAIVNEGGVEGTKMFGIGGRAFTRAIERELDIDFNEAEALKVAMSSNKVPSNKLAEAEAAIIKTLKVWQNGVELALSEFSKLDHLPNQILLCGGGSSLDMLVKSLSETDWYKDLPFTKRPTVHHISPEEVIGITDSTGMVADHTFITAMGLLRVGLDTMSTSGESGGEIKQKMQRILKV